MSYLEPTTHASLALEDSMRHLPEFKPTTKRVDWLLSVLASAREARELGMTRALVGLGPHVSQSLKVEEFESLEADLVLLGYRVRWLEGSDVLVQIEWS